LESKKNNLEQFYVKNKKIFYFTIAFLLLVAFLVTFFL
jgi:acetyl-CoA carboxylase carboxyl transferase subunit alpha